MRRKQECKNTEQMKINFYDTNYIKIPETMQRILLSMDVESIYLSLIKDIVMEEVKTAVKETKVTIEGIDWQMFAVHIYQRFKYNK